MNQHHCRCRRPRWWLYFLCHNSDAVFVLSAVFIEWLLLPGFAIYVFHSWSFLLFSSSYFHFKADLESERDFLSVHSSVAVRAGSGSGRSQEPKAHLLSSVSTGAQALVHLLLPLQCTSAERRIRSTEAGYELSPSSHAIIAGGRLTHYATAQGTHGVLWALINKKKMLVIRFSL